jgi:hypothetical protein
LTSALNSDSEFGFRIFSYGFISTTALDSNFLFVSYFDSTADFIFCKFLRWIWALFSLGVANLALTNLNFFISDLDLDFL